MSAQPTSCPLFVEQYPTRQPQAQAFPKTHPRMLQCQDHQECANAQWALLQCLAPQHPQGNALCTWGEPLDRLKALSVHA